eukprot:scaffold30850_cov73-Phaeocystis_antarctica.AAC.5
MPSMSVTLDVSRLSIWLNADADCRVGSRGEVRRGEVRKWEGHKMATAQVACRGAHPKHAGHGCDAGGVETQRLVERRRALPSQRRAYDERRGAGYRRL